MGGPTESHHGDTAPANRHPSRPEWRAVDEYFRDAFSLEDGPLGRARRSGALTTLPNAEVTANQGAMLALLVRSAGARRVLEFGTLAGYSTIFLARAVGGDGVVVSLELEPGNAEIARENLTLAGVGDRVQIVVGAAAESARRLLAENAAPFDFAFIDADKPSNPEYLALALQLTSPGALIVIDNVVRAGAVMDPGSVDPRVLGVRRLVDAIAADPTLEATAIQTVGVKGWDGFILVRRR